MPFLQMITARYILKHLQHNQGDYIVLDSIRNIEYFYFKYYVLWNIVHLANEMSC